MNKLNHLRSERGQALIQFALMFMGLLAFVALAIEAGNVYGVRRQLQNAADASALAATAGVSAVHHDLLVLRALGHRVEPMMALLQEVRGAWRQLHWGLEPRPPRIWAA